MCSRPIQIFVLMSSFISVIVGLLDNTSCTPNRFILLSNCTFKYPSSVQKQSFLMTVETRNLSMIVPHEFNRPQDEYQPIEIIKRPLSTVPLMRLNLNLIQCSSSRLFKWSSIEASSTLRGEFIRTNLLDSNRMYLSLGVTYLRNLTRIDCSRKILYQTDSDQIFRVNFKTESTLNDSCHDETSCAPTNVYECDHERRRCACRPPLQSYLTKDKHLICIQAVQTADQCTLKGVRCLSWCDRNSSSSMCFCPEQISIKRHFEHDEDRAYCQARTNGICNPSLQCPSGEECIDGICQNGQSKRLQFISVDISTVSIIVSSLILFLLITIVAISLCLLRRQRWKQRSHSSVYKKKQEIPLPTTSDYDNIIYGAFHHNLHLSSSSDDPMNDRSPFSASDFSSSSYQPRIVYLGGDQQLTAIYA